MRVVVYRSIVPSDPGAADYLESTTADTMRLLEQQPGFEQGHWARTYGTDEITAVTYWDSLDAITAAEQALAGLQEQREQNGITVTSVRNMRLLDVPVSA